MINAMKLNSISNSLYAYKTADSYDKVIKVCSSDGMVTRKLNRDEIVSANRLATVEYFGKIANMDKNSMVKYNSKCGDDYATLQKGAWEDTVLYCAALANREVGREAYKTMAEVEADRNLYMSKTFWRALSYIAQEVIEPLYPAVIPAATDRLINWSYSRMGETKLIDIPSNDFFLFDDDSWGAVSSKPYQYLYKSQIALTPKPYTAKTKIKWYQDIIDGEAGRYFAAFMRGAYNKMYAIMLSKFKTALSNTKYMPTGLTWDGFSAQNWTEAVMVAAAVNGVDKSQLVAMGTLSGLSNIVPTVGDSAVAAGIQGELGTEWVRNGFFANVFGVDLIETGLAVVPHTQNYNPKFISMDDETNSNIYIMAKVGRAPMEGVIANGSPITITFTPEETADMTIDISETIIFDIQPAFSQKIVKLTI